MSYTAAVITVSDLGVRESALTNGPAVCAMLESAGFFRRPHRHCPG